MQIIATIFLRFSSKKTDNQKSSSDTKSTSLASVPSRALPSYTAPYSSKKAANDDTLSIASSNATVITDASGTTSDVCSTKTFEEEPNLHSSLRFVSNYIDKQIRTSLVKRIIQISFLGCYNVTHLTFCQSNFRGSIKTGLDSNSSTLTSQSHTKASTKTADEYLPYQSILSKYSSSKYSSNDAEV